MGSWLSVQRVNFKVYLSHWYIGLFFLGKIQKGLHWHFFKYYRDEKITAKLEKQNGLKKWW